jgi:hypothetical protein
MVIKLKVDIDEIFEVQSYHQAKYKEHGLEIKDFIYICNNYIMYIIEL